METFKAAFVRGVEDGFITEIVFRTFFMFLFILLVLRLSGRRGVRQLTLFEVAIILSLGSAAGDPMFQGDLPLVYALIVMLTVIFTYKGVTWLAARNQKINSLLEGKPIFIVWDGTFNLDDGQKNNIDILEFLSELRNYNIEHLGQVRRALLEVDGSVSVLYYSKEETRYGLPIFPDQMKPYVFENTCDYIACENCGYTTQVQFVDNEVCPRCKKNKWIKAKNDIRIT